MPENRKLTFSPLQGSFLQLFLWTLLLLIFFLSCQNSQSVHARYPESIPSIFHTFTQEFPFSCDFKIARPYVLKWTLNFRKFSLGCFLFSFLVSLYNPLRILITHFSWLIYSLAMFAFKEPPALVVQLSLLWLTPVNFPLWTQDGGFPKHRDRTKKSRSGNQY